MNTELDHFFVLTGFGAPIADLLLDTGLVEGTANHHPGQGTSNRRFFLSNSTFEFLYLRDSNEAVSGPGRGLCFPDRLSDIHASPFGLVVRTDSNCVDEPFPSWRYFPEYFGNDMSFLVGENSNDLEEPLCICMPPALPKPAVIPIDNAAWRLINLELSIPGRKASPTLELFGQCENVTIKCNEPHHLKVLLSYKFGKGTLNLEPKLPVLIEW